MTYYVHVNVNTIRSNKKHGKDEAPIIVRNGRYGSSEYCNDVSISGPCRIHYNPDGILPCGAKVVIETDVEPTIRA